MSVRLDLPVLCSLSWGSSSEDQQEFFEIWRMLPLARGHRLLIKFYDRNEGKPFLEWHGTANIIVLAGVGRWTSKKTKSWTGKQLDEMDRQFHRDVRICFPGVGWFPYHEMFHNLQCPDESATLDESLITCVTHQSCCMRPNASLPWPMTLSFFQKVCGKLGCWPFERASLGGSGNKTAKQNSSRNRRSKSQSKPTSTNTASPAPSQQRSRKRQKTTRDSCNNTAMMSSASDLKSRSSQLQHDAAITGSPPASKKRKRTTARPVARPTKTSSKRKLPERDCPEDDHGFHLCSLLEMSQAVPGNTSPPHRNGTQFSCDCWTDCYAVEQNPDFECSHPCHVLELQQDPAKHLTVSYIDNLTRTARSTSLPLTYAESARIKGWERRIVCINGYKTTMTPSSSVPNAGPTAPAEFVPTRDFSCVLYDDLTETRSSEYISEFTQNVYQALILDGYCRFKNLPRPRCVGWILSYPDESSSDVPHKQQHCSISSSVQPTAGHDLLIDYTAVKSFVAGLPLSESEDFRNRKRDLSTTAVLDRKSFWQWCLGRLCAHLHATFIQVHPIVAAAMRFLLHSRLSVTLDLSSVLRKPTTVQHAEDMAEEAQV